MDKIDKGYTIEDVIKAVQVLGSYTWYEYCTDCLIDSELKEDEDFICMDIDCPIYVCREALNDIKVIERRKQCLKK